MLICESLADSQETQKELGISMEPPWTPERHAGWLTPKSFSLLDSPEFPGKDGENLKLLQEWITQSILSLQLREVL